MTTPAASLIHALKKPLRASPDPVISFLAIMVVCLVPFVLIMRRPTRAAAAQAAH